MALEIIVDIQEANLLEKSVGRLKCFSLSLTFACFEFVIMV
jgi:hypothetical protein